MSNVAILVGNTEYRSLPKLDCCRADMLAMKELLDATQKYESIEIIENADSNDLKSKIRLVVEKGSPPDELFFYYSGHGYSHEQEFFYCATNFDSSRPNETGLSTTDLHTFLRLANAGVVIKVADACNSGTHLVKSDIGLTLQNKQGFRNLIQISSCLDSQSSFTGHPLSVFTEKFRNAALSKTEGIIYYTDVIAALRDQFIGNDVQTPFFVSQYTGREQFVDDARKLEKVREAVKKREEPLNLMVSAPARSQTLSEVLIEVESRLATPEKMNAFVDGFFDALKVELTTIEVADLFQVDFQEHDDFNEPTAKRFIIEVLSREKRPDNFVTADISRKHRRKDPFNLGLTNALASFYDDEQYVELYDLVLNCKMSRAQLRITLTPKFSTLRRIVLVMTCAPSLETCYVFEIATQHLLHDFGKYDSEGTKAVERWYKFGWQEGTQGVVRKVSSALSKLVQEQIVAVSKQLSPR